MRVQQSSSSFVIKELMQSREGKNPIGNREWTRINADIGRE